MHSSLHAIVLHKQLYKDNDALITVFSLEEGKLTLFAKGVNKLQSKFRGYLQPGAILMIEIIHSKNIPLIKELKSIFLPEMIPYSDLIIFEESLNNIRSICKQHQKIENVFHRLAAFINEFLSYKDKPIYLLLFQIQLLTITGFLGDLHNCIDCKQKFSNNDQYFSLEYGCICKNCVSSYEYTFVLPFSLLKFFVFFQRHPIAEYRKILLSEEQKIQLLKIGTALVSLYFPKN